MIIKKLVMAGIGHFIGRCVYEWEEVNAIIPHLHSAQEAAYQTIKKGATQEVREVQEEDNSSNDSCLPCEICQIKMNAITAILNKEEIPNIDSRGAPLDTLDRVSIYMATRKVVVDGSLN